MTVMMLVKSRHATAIMRNGEKSYEFFLQIRSFDGELHVGFTKLVIFLIDDNVSL